MWTEEAIISDCTQTKDSMKRARVRDVQRCRWWFWAIRTERKGGLKIKYSYMGDEYINAVNILFNKLQLNPKNAL